MATTLAAAQNIPELIGAGNWPGATTGTTITYSFLNFLPSYYGSATAIAPGDVFAGAMGSSQQADIITVLNEISQLTNITFVPVSQSATVVGDITFGLFNNATNPKYGFSYSYGNSVSDQRLWGDTYFSNNNFPTLQGVRHEILHALGFKHPMPYQQGEQGPFFASDPGMQFTNLSYASPGTSVNGFALYDVAVLQKTYGANTTFHSGDDTYSDWSGLNGNNKPIWDAGGTDTIDASGAQWDTQIDLRQGYFSSIDTVTSNQGSALNGLSQNVSIAFGSKIENAKGSTRKDIIIGNELSNKILSEGGDDTIYGDADALANAGQTSIGFKGDVFLDLPSLSASIDILVGGDGKDKIASSPFRVGNVTAPQYFPASGPSLCSI